MKLVHVFGAAAALAIVANGAWVGCGGGDASLVGSDDGGTEAANSGAASGMAASGTTSSGAGTSGTAASGAGTSGAVASGAGTSGAATSGAGTSGTATSGAGTSGTATSGTGTSGTATSGAGSSGAIAPDAGAAECVKYCTDIEGACGQTGDRQYASSAECLAACSILSASNMATGMDTIACRTTHATNAVAKPYPHCWHAGPYGYEVCGTECEAFCILADSVCPGTYTGCRGKCPMLTKVAAPDTAAGAAGVYTTSGPATGNTLDCREYHLGLALQGIDKAVSCANAGDKSPKCM
ncbi:MAG TPA: hypothetical protein VGY54_27245 [Polyangiaceae bacterium]|nr:hypothetical protein [Polyangiaceae bacterium]